MKSRLPLASAVVVVRMSCGILAFFFSFQVPNTGEVRPGGQLGWCFQHARVCVVTFLCRRVRADSVCCLKSLIFCFRKFSLDIRFSTKKI